MGVDARLDSLVAGYRVERLLGRAGAGSVWGNTGFTHTAAVRLRLRGSVVQSVDLGSDSPDLLAYTNGALWGH